MDRTRSRGILAMVVPLLLAVNCGFFPIVNFNPDNPVDLGITMRTLIFLSAFAAHWRFGGLEARVLPGRSLLFIGLFNTALVSGGLLARYLLEFGEVSNAYNFTLTNAAFHVLVLAAAATVSFGLETLSAGLAAGRDRLRRKKEFP